MTHTTGRDAFLALLQDEGISHLFGNPGTTELPIMDALADHQELRYVLGLQESVAMAMADGFSRASNRLSAVNVHVAPGLGNALGALYNAKWYGSPVLITAGQQEQGHGLTEPMLYDPLVPMAEPLVKWAIEVTRLEDLPRIVRRAAKVALTPPTGPVFISLPGDILNAAGELELGRSTRLDAATQPALGSLTRFAERLLACQSPVIISGHEVATEDALQETAELAELLGAPVYMQTVPYSAQFISEHPHFMGSLGRDQKRVRALLEQHDLLVVVGADLLRMSVWSPVDPLPTGMPIVQIGQRPWELGKNYPVELALYANVKYTLKALLPVLTELRGPEHAKTAEQRFRGMRTDNWSRKREALVSATLSRSTQRPIFSDYLMHCIAQELPANGVIVEEGLVSTRNLLNFLPLRDSRQYFGLASGGIGFAISGAIGIHLALPERPLWAVIGDGSAMYGIQALWTAAHLKLPITYIICNNRGYRILKERLVGFNGAALAAERFIGMDLREPAIDFFALAQSMGVQARRISEPDEVIPALRESLSSQGPLLLDVSLEDGFGT